MPNLSVSLNTFSLKLFNQLFAGKNENSFISPYSISTALAMCYAGAHAETARQLKALLDLTEFADDDEQLFQATHAFVTNLNEGMANSVQLNTANKIYPRFGYSLDNAFVDKIRKGFGGDVEELDYAQKEQAAKVINDWVESQTAKKITNLIPSSAITPDTMMILVNAIYFKGSWATPFQERQTEKHDFSLLDGSLKQCDMMRLNGKSFKVLTNPFGLACQTCELPYVGDKVAMTIVLPNKDVNLADFERSLKPNHINDLLTMRGGEDKINIQVPKFKLEKQFELVDHFKKMGITAPFDKLQADFRGISGKPDLFISNVVHKAVVEVNEEGTVAAAATGIIMMTRAFVMIEPRTFIADRPFLFIIHEKISNTVLFLGKFVDPSQ